MGYSIGHYFLPYYGSLIVLGLIVASVVGALQVKRFGKDINDMILLAAMGGLCGMVGAKALYLIVSWRDIDLTKITDLSYINSLMGGGFVFYGGLIGGGFGLLLGRRLFHLSDLSGYLSICIPCVPLAHGFGRLGCSAAGCCYGIPFNSAFSVIYHNSPFAPNGVPLFPIQLTEAVGNFLITAILLLYVDVLKRNRGVFLYIFLYAPMRFALEFFRYDEERGHIGILSVSQWVSILLVLAAALLCTLSVRRSGHNTNTN